MLSGTLLSLADFLEACSFAEDFIFSAFCNKENSKSIGSTSGARSAARWDRASRGLAARSSLICCTRLVEEAAVVVPGPGKFRVSSLPAVRG